MSDRRPTVMWFRRDLRLRDHPALAAAAENGPVTALFVLDDVLLRSNAGVRTAYLYRTLRALDDDLRGYGGRLTVRRGRPEDVVPRVAGEVGAGQVHVSADFAPYGAARDRRVEAALGAGPGIALVRTGSPYAVSPGRVTKDDGEPYQVFTPFYRAWARHGWRAPAASDPARVEWHPLAGDDLPDEPHHEAELPPAGEAAAHELWTAFCEGGLDRYETDRDRPDLDSTSHLSPHLRFGTIHPRTMLADLGRRGEAYRRQLCWRDFYAAVQHFRPDSAHGYFRPVMRQLRHDTGRQADGRFEAWASGRTGYPLVDAGMRQLLATGWMHNRVRMVVASFLVKDLHLEWTRGARHFMDHLVDADLANNQHGWQWAAGTGTDPAPYVRVFNPVTQAQRFDPDGDFVRRWVPELRGVPGKAVHEPWDLDPPPPGYPPPVVDHRAEREESLRRFAALS